LALAGLGVGGRCPGSVWIGAVRARCGWALSGLGVGGRCPGSVWVGAVRAPMTTCWMLWCRVPLTRDDLLDVVVSRAAWVASFRISWGWCLVDRPIFRKSRSVVRRICGAARARPHTVGRALVMSMGESRLVCQ
jgi:hypothetical protein